MKVFFSWSGQRSHAVAMALGPWLRRLIQAIQPWDSTNIPKGSRWGREVTTELEKTRVGIICLTNDNLKAPWILFEAGALSKTSDGLVATFLLDVASADVEPPLGQFQHTTNQKEDIRKLVRPLDGNRIGQTSATRGSSPWAGPIVILEGLMTTFQLGLDTFGDVTVDTQGALHSHAHTLREVVREAVLAEEVGIEAFGVGEHHRPDFSISAPEVVLAAIAGRTERLVLGSAVTVLSTDDPVRVFERFSTLNALSNGRAEVILGRGSFTESYPLFGYDLSNYEELFEEKLALFAKLLKSGPVSWTGRTRAALTGQTVYPPVEHGPLRTWVGVGGSPDSVRRAARYGLPLTLAIIGGDPQRFRPYVDLYYESLERHGQPKREVAVHSPGHVANTDAEAKAELWPHYQAMMARIGAERGWPPPTRAQFEREAGPGGALCVGSPETVAAKITNTARLLDLSRFNMKYSNGTLAHDKLMRSIELFGTEVAPRVRERVRAMATQESNV